MPANPVCQSWRWKGPGPILPGHFIFVPEHKTSLVLAPAAPIPHAPDCPSPRPLERRTLSSQKTNLFLFHQNVVADLADLSSEKW